MKRLILLFGALAGIAAAQCGKSTVNPFTGKLECVGNIVSGTFTARGTYAGGTTYAALDLVAYNGVSYVSLQNSNTGHQPDTSPTFWALPGPAGPTGATGATGPAGPAPAGDGVVKVTAGVAGLVSGTATDCVKVDGSSGACSAGGALLAANNLSDVASVTTSRGNLIASGTGSCTNNVVVALTTGAPTCAALTMAFFDSTAVSSASGTRAVVASSVPADGCATFSSGVLGSTGSACGSGGGGGADALGRYLVSTSTNAPVNAVNLGALSTGLLKISVAGGTATPSTATSGTDYAPATTGSGPLKGNGSGGFSAAAASDIVALWTTCGSNYMKGNGTCDTGTGGGSLPSMTGHANGVLSVSSDETTAEWHGIGSGLLNSLVSGLSIDSSVVATFGNANTWTNSNAFQNTVTVSGASASLDASGSSMSAPIRKVTVLPGSCTADIETVILSTDHQVYVCNAVGTGWVSGSGGGGTPGGSNGQIQYNNSGSFGGISTTGGGNVVLATSPTIVTPTIADQTNMQHDHSNAAGGGNLTATAMGSGAKQGNGTKFQMFGTGTPSTDDCAKFDASGNITTAGAPCGSGGGGGTGVGRKTLSATWSTILDGNCSDQTATWTGVTTSDTVVVGPAASSTWTQNAFVSAADTVKIRLCAIGADVTPGTLNLNAVLAVYNLSGAGTIDFPNILDGTCNDQTFSLTGVAAGDPLAAKWPSALPASLSGNMIASATDTVKVHMCAIGADVDAGSLSYGVTVAK